MTDINVGFLPMQFVKYYCLHWQKSPKHCVLVKYSETCEPIFDNQPSEQIVQKQTEVFPFWTLFCHWYNLKERMINTLFYQNVQNHVFDPFLGKQQDYVFWLWKLRSYKMYSSSMKKLLNCGKFKIPRHFKIPPNLKRLPLPLLPLFTTSITEMLRFNIHQKSNENMIVQHYKDSPHQTVEWNI